MFSIHFYDNIEFSINYHWSEADKHSMATYGIGMEVGNWWIPDAGSTCGLFSVHPAVTSDYVWNLFGSPTKLEIQYNKIVLRTVYYPIPRFIQIVIVEYATYIRSVIPRNPNYRRICG